MNGKASPLKRNLDSSSEETNTSSSNKELPTHIVNLKESKTHLFYVIQSDNENNGNGQRFVRIKISKERPTTSRKLGSKKTLLRHGNNSVTDKNQAMHHSSNLTGIHKRSDHPSFVVLPELVAKRSGNVRRNIETNQSTSENSNETYVIRSKMENKMLVNRRQGPALFDSLWKKKSSIAIQQGGYDFKPKLEPGGYCECDKNENAAKFTNKSGGYSSQPIKTEAKTKPQSYLTKDDLFNINFVKPDEKDKGQRLRAGQDYDRKYKSCCICTNMKRIFPPPSHRTALYSNSSGGNSDASVKKRCGYVKVNLKLIRQCLISASADEKSAVLDAIRLRMRSSDIALHTIDSIVKYDLFGVQCECRSTPLLEELLWPIDTSYKLQTSAARFVNALVSYKKGRRYFSNRSIIRLLIWGEIGRHNIDSNMGDNLIGIMMKLSWNRFHRSDMIKNGLFRWLLQHMEEEEYSASKYHLQCMTGLLRNLLRGYNLENLSSTEMQKLIILLGRYLETDDLIAKRYICDSLRTLFQNANSVASAKELNFHRVIEEHVENADNPMHRKHLRAIYQLLNRSSTSQSHSIQKIESLIEEEPYIDADLEPDLNEDIDYYTGECLLREKFSEDLAAAQNQNKKPLTAAADDKRREGKLISRVFFENLNCFLPNIDSNRIFPLCNARCADKIVTCDHIGDIPRKKRQHYIPPKSRKPGMARHNDWSVDQLQDGDYKSKMKSSADDKQSIIHERSVSRISTISHDRSAPQWESFKGSNESDASRGGETMRRVFVGSSMEDASGGRQTLYDSKREEVTRKVSYRHDASESIHKLNEGSASDEECTADKRLDETADQYSTGSNELDREVTDKDATKNKKRLTKSEEEVKRAKGEVASERGRSLAMKKSEDDNRRTISGATDQQTLIEKQKLLQSGNNVEGCDVATKEIAKGDKSHRPIPTTSTQPTTLPQRAEQAEKEEHIAITSPERAKQSEKGKHIRQTTSVPLRATATSTGTSGVQPTTSTNKEEQSHGKANIQQSVSAPQSTASSKGSKPYQTERKESSTKKMTRSDSNVDDFVAVTETEKHLKQRRDETDEVRKGGVRQGAGRGSEFKRIRIAGDDLGENEDEAKQTKIDGRESAKKLSFADGGQQKRADAARVSPKSVVRQEVERKLTVRSRDVLTGTKSAVNQQPKLNVRSENLLIKTSATTTTTATTKTHLLKARSTELLSEASDKGHDRRKVHYSRSEASLNTGSTDKRLKVRSQEAPLGLKKGEAKSPTEPKLIPRSKESVANDLLEQTTATMEATTKLSVRSSEMLTQNAPDNVSQMDVQMRVRSLENMTDVDEPSGHRKRGRLLRFSSHDLLNEDIKISQNNKQMGGKRKITIRSREVASLRRKNRSHSATAVGNNDSSQSLTNKSNDCVDCEGSGYVLRARPSQPCDRCKTSLSKYPNFVESLNSEGFQRRLVTRTSDEQIKVTWLQKSGEKVSTKTIDDGKSGQDQHNESNTQGKLTEPKSDKNAHGENGSGADDIPKPTRKAGNETSESINLVKEIQEDRAAEENEMKTSNVSEEISIVKNSQTDEPNKESSNSTSDGCPITEDNVKKEWNSKKELDEKIELVPSETNPQPISLRKIEHNESGAARRILKRLMLTSPNDDTHISENNQLSGAAAAVKSHAHGIVIGTTVLYLSTMETNRTARVISNAMSNFPNPITVPNSLKFVQYTTSLLNNRVGFGRARSNPNFSDELPHLIERTISSPCLSTSEIGKSTDAVRFADDINGNESTSSVGTITNRNCFMLTSRCAQDLSMISDTQSHETVTDVVSLRPGSTEEVAIRRDAHHAVNSSAIEPEENREARENILAVDLLPRETPTNNKTENFQITDLNSQTSAGETFAKNEISANETIAPKESDTRVSVAQQCQSDAERDQNQSESNEKISQDRLNEIVTTSSTQSDSGTLTSNKKPGAFSEETNESILAIKSIENVAEEIVEAALELKHGEDYTVARIRYEPVLAAKSHEPTSTETAVLRDSQSGSISSSNELSDDGINGSIPRWTENLTKEIVNDVLSIEEENKWDDQVMHSTAEDVIKCTVSVGAHAVKSNEPLEKANEDAGSTVDQRLVLQKIEISLNELRGAQYPDETGSATGRVLPECNESDEIKSTLTETTAQYTLSKMLENEATVGEESNLLNILVKQSIVNVNKAVLDEVLIKHRNLQLEKPANESDRTACVKGRIVSPTCFRQLLNDDDLIDKLSEKVLAKLRSEIPSCGPNCKSPCCELKSEVNNKNLNG